MGDAKALTVVHDQPMELSVIDVQNQVAKIQGLMASLMKDGEHFGVIPGTQKPSLYKAGAEKIGFIFRLAPEYAIDRDDLIGGHREYRITCRLRHMGTGTTVGEGVGSCSTMESKYRWRNQATTEEVGPVPKGYWDLPKDDHKARSKALEDTYGSGKYQPKKKDGAWVVLRVTGDGDRVENPDIADQYNTVLKMAKKRAFVDATITATAASDFFTQDIEDFRDDAPTAGRGQNEPPTETKPAPKAESKPAPAQPESTSSAPKAMSSTRRTQVISYIGQNTTKLTDEQLAEIRKDLSHAGTTPPLLDAVEAKARGYIAENEAVGMGWEEEHDPRQTVEDIPVEEGGQAASAEGQPGLGIF